MQATCAVNKSPQIVNLVTVQAVCAKIPAVYGAPFPTINFNHWLWLTSYIVNLYLHYGSIFKNNQCSLTYFIVLLFSFINQYIFKCIFGVLHLYIAYFDSRNMFI